MAKLMYINQGATNAKTWLKNNDTNSPKKDWNVQGNIYYRSLVFTSDGHILSHGQDIGNQITLNGSPATNPSFYAPTGPGSSGYILKSNGENSAPSWLEVVDTILNNTESSHIPNVGAVRNLVSTEIASTGAMLYKGTYTGQSSSQNTVNYSGFYEGSSPLNQTNCQGWTWLVTGASGGTTKYFGNVQVSNGDLIIAKVASPGDTISNYDVISTGTTGTVTSVTITLGTGITVSSSGTAITTSGTRTISLKAATDTTIGGIKVSEKYTETTIPDDYWNLAIHTTSSNPTNLAYAIPKAATNSYLGAVKPWFITSGESTVASGSVNSYDADPAINARSATAGKYYGVEIDRNGRLFVNVPWENTQTTNTWRPVAAYTIASNGASSLSVNNSVLNSDPPTTGTKTLSFGSEFLYVENDNSLDNSEIHLAWADVTVSGNTHTINYYV